MLHGSDHYRKRPVAVDGVVHIEDRRLLDGDCIMKARTRKYQC